MAFIALSFVLLMATFVFTRRAALAWRIIGTTAIVAAAWILLWASQIMVRAGEGVWYEHTPAKQIIAMVLTMLGMAGKYLFDVIDARRKRTDAGDRKARLHLDWWDFAQPFIVAAIVFGSFWEGHGDETLDVTWLVMSFQNGFFWQTVLGKGR